MDALRLFPHRRHLAYGLCALLLLLCAWSRTGSAAQNLPFTLGPPFLNLQMLVLDSTDRDWLDQRKVLRVGIAIADYEPIDITSDRNRYQGVSADYLGLISSKLSMPVQVMGFAKRDEALTALRDGRIDLLTSANGYERAVTDLAFTREYMPDRAVVVGLGNDASLTASLKGKRVVLLDGYADADVVHRAYPDSQIILAPSLHSAFEALIQDDADAFIGNEVIARSYSALRPYLGLQIKFESALPLVGFAFALRRDDTRLLGLVDRSLASLDESVGREIMSRWTAGLGADVVGQRLQFSAAEQRWIRRNNQVTVAASQHPPYLFKDANDRWVGLNADILARISRMSGLQFVFLETSSTQQTLDALINGQADMNTSLAENPERKQLLDFTYSFGGNSWVFVVRDDQASPVGLGELNGKTLALPARHALEAFIKDQYPQIHLRRVDTYEDARRLVEEGKAEATIQNEVGAWMYPPGRLKVGRSVDGKWSPDRFSVLKSEPELLSILNKALEEFPVAEMRAIRVKWLGAVISQPSMWQQVPAWVYWSMGFAVLLVLVSLGWNSRLQFQIRQRLQAQEQLRDQLAFKRALFDGIPNPIYVRDLQGRLVSCNRSYEESFGISFEQMNGRRLIDVNLIPRPIAERMHADYMALLDTQEPVFIDRSMELFGKPIEAWQWTVPFYRADGELQGLLGGWIDITERKRLERDLIAARQQADQANRAKTEFLTTMSHDIRTPMAAIIGLLELERERAIARGEDPSLGLDIAWRSAQELIVLIGESLDLAKIESGQLQLSLAPTQLQPLLEDAFQLFERQAQLAGVALTLRVAPQAHGYYWLDPLRLRQVLHNLIGNALKFTCEGSVSIVVDCIGLDQQNVRLNIRVADTGVGISAEQQALVFQPFSQATAERAIRFGGSGLGLSICKQLMTLMGGKIHLSSEEGLGTQVDIDLIVAVAAAPSASIAARPVMIKAVKPLRLLVVDDLSSSRLVLDQQLTFMGHHVTALSGAEAALQTWQDQPFDAVISDCNMPGMNGYELAQAIRQIEHVQGLSRCPVIGCTANAMSDERERCVASGMDALLVKPVSLAQLTEQLEGLGVDHADEFSSEQPFDIQTLLAMTQANDAQMQRMLTELWRNLYHEQVIMVPAVSERNWSALSASIHRLKGIACLIDAVPLAKSCAQLDSRVRAQSATDLAPSWQSLQIAIDALRADLQTHLRETPSL
jgi:two-component system sensor histidine kinase EvgS